MPAVFWDTTRNASGHLSFSNSNQAVTYTGTAGTNSCSFSSNFNFSGKWICRFNIVQTAATGGHTSIGFGDSTATTAGGFYLGEDTHSFSIAYDNAAWGINNVNTNSGLVSFATGDIIDIAVSLGAKLAWVRKNAGSWFGNNGAGDPVAGTNGFDISGLASFTISPGCDLVGGTPNDSIDIGVQTSTTSGYQAWGIVVPYTQRKHRTFVVPALVRKG